MHKRIKLPTKNTSLQANGYTKNLILLGNLAFQIALKLIFRVTNEGSMY